MLRALGGATAGGLLSALTVCKLVDDDIMVSTYSSACLASVGSALAIRHYLVGSNYKALYAALIDYDSKTNFSEETKSNV